MIELSFAEKIARIDNAYHTLRRSIHWDRKLSRMEWDRDCCRYPLRGYFKQRMNDNIKAAWCLRNLIRDLRKPVWDDATINLGVGKYPFS
ncbi:hypothetical protein [Akkermansia massiliensis]